MRLRKNRSNMLGISLIELLIGMAIGLLVISGAIVVFSSVVGSQSSMLKAMRLEQELRSIMDLMSRDLRRAGYWSMARFAARPLGAITPSGVSGSIILASGAGSTPFLPFGAAVATATPKLKVISSAGFAEITSYISGASVGAKVTRNFTSKNTIADGRWMIVNPFMDADAGTDIVVSGSCIQYAYDVGPYVAGNPPVAVVDMVADGAELYGFRRTSNASGVGVVQMHTGGAINCANGTGSWTKVSTDNVVNVTALSFTKTNYRCVNINTGTDCNQAHAGTGYVAPVTGQVLVEMREVKITMEGQLIGDADVKRTLVENVRVRNDRIIVY